MRNYTRGQLVNKIVEILVALKLISEEFYGKITLSFEAGKITLIRKEETFKP